MTEPAIRLDGIRVWLEDGSVILNNVSWTVGPGERWALLGPNGAGKTTLLNVATARRYPSRGKVEILGRTFGKSSMLELREQIAIVDPHQRVYDWFTALEIVLTGTTGTVQPNPDGYSGGERDRAAGHLAALGIAGLADREVRTLSHGEKQRVRIARALMQQPRIVVLDEPAVGLDFPAREALVSALTDLGEANPELVIVTISHHFEELAPNTTHAALMRQGEIVGAGPVGEILTDGPVSDAFGIPVEISRQHGRWSARASGSWSI